MIPAVELAGKGVTTLATQRVIGYTRSKTYTKGRKNKQVIQENLNIGIQAWELGVLLASVAAYEYVNGPGSFILQFGNALSNAQWSSITNPVIGR